MNAEPVPKISANEVGRSSQIVSGAMMAGLLTFSVVAVVMAQKKESQLGIITCMAAGLFVVVGTMGYLVSQSLANREIQKISEEKSGNWQESLAPVYLSKTLILHACLEGPGVVNCVAHIVEAHWLNLALVLAILVLMALTFPSQMKFDAWSEQVQRDHS